jgi:SEC-C motif
MFNADAPLTEQGSSSYNLPTMSDYSFTELGLSGEDLKVLAELQRIRRDSQEHLAGPIQFPEPGFVLDLELRAPSESRQFAHIHQMCLLHATHFELASKIKTTYILDAYLWAAAQLNPVAVYSAARSLFELHAVLRYVDDLLCAAQAGTDAEWRERGQRYFDVILQARYGTSDQAMEQLLITNGCPEGARRPFKIAKARALLVKELPWANEHYGLLCDFVHPNLSSQRTASAYAGESNVALSSGGGQLLLPGKSPILQYQFPMPEPGRSAVTRTAKRALENTLGIVSSMNHFPRTPFSETELLARTGSRIGLKSPSVTSHVAFPRVGRNESCPCGSGKKYKKCHAAAVVN